MIENDLNGDNISSENKVPKDFDWKIYLELNPDVALYNFYNSEYGAMYHWKTFGYTEKRKYKKVIVKSLTKPIPKLITKSTVIKKDSPKTKHIECIISSEMDAINPFEPIKKMIIDIYSKISEYDNYLVILGYNKMNMSISDFKKKYPTKKIVIYQLEQLNDCNSHWYNTKSEDPYIIEATNSNKKKLKKCDEIWDYDLDNIKFLKSEGFKNVKYIPLQYSEALLKKNKIKKPKYDILFFGSLNDKRLKYLDILSSKYNICIIAPKNEINRYTKTYPNLKKQMIESVYGDELFSYVFDSKIIINLHYYDSNIQEQVRIFELLINNKFVLSEKSKRNTYENIIYEFNDEIDMVNKIDFILKFDIWKKGNISDKFKNLSNIKLQHTAKKRILVTTSSFGQPLDSEWVNQITNNDIEVVFNRVSADVKGISSKSDSMLPRLRAKTERMIMWDLQPNYDYYVWLDSSFSILKEDSIQWIVDQCTDEVDAVFFKHSARKSVKEELCFVMDQITTNKYLKNRYYNEPLVEEVNSYFLDSDFNDTFLIEAGLFIYKNNIVENKEYNMMKEWFYNNCKWSILDQLSLPYLLQKFKIKFKFFETTIYDNPYFYFKHWEK